MNSISESDVLLFEQLSRDPVTVCTETETQPRSEHPGPGLTTTGNDEDLDGSHDNDDEEPNNREGLLGMMYDGNASPKLSGNKRREQVRNVHFGEAAENALDPEEEFLEKQMLLLDLQALQREGVELSRKFTMNDSARSMSFELNRVTSNLEMQDNVDKLLDMMKIGMKGVELLNDRMGPVLNLNGWNQVVDTERPRFRNVVSKLYRKHWRKGMTSPETDLAILLASSAFLHHFTAPSVHATRMPTSLGGLMGNLSSLFGKKPGGGPRVGIPRPTMQMPSVNFFPKI